MPYAPLTRIHANDTTEALNAATSVIEESGIVELLNPGDPDNPDPESSAEQTPASAGRPARLPKYTLLAILATILELAWRGTHFSWSNVAHALWFRYTEEQMTSIGLPNWRQTDRLDQLKPIQEGALATSKQVDAARRAWHAEVNRLWAFVDRALAPIDDTALSGHKRHKAALFEAEHANNPTLQAKRTLQMDVVNALIRASLVHANKTYYPDVDSNDVLGGLLQHHKGDLAVDEHNIVVALSHNNKPGTQSIKQRAGMAGHVRREGVAQAIGLSAAIAVSRPDGYRIPNVVLGVDLHAPATEASQGGRNCISHVQHNGLRPPMASTSRQHVVTDKAYARYVGYTEWLIANRYNIVTKYHKDLPDFHDLAPTPEADSRTSPSTGPYLFKGACLCPGIGAKTLRNNNDFDTPQEWTMTPDQVRDHAVTEKQLKGAVMPTNGRPKLAVATGRGRPRTGAIPIENTYRVQVACPAAVENAKVRCPIIPETMNLDPKDHPTLHHAPLTGPRPLVCQTGTQTVELGIQQIKVWQGTLAGTWDHQDMYGPARTHNEWFFGRLMDPDCGNLALGAIEWNKNAPVALAIACALAVTNLRIIAAYEEDVLGNNNTPLRETGPKRRRLRANMLKKD